MRDHRFRLVYKGDNGFHFKKYHISEIGAGLNKICDIHNIMAFSAWNQYTGRVDQNDANIYEGDICSYTCDIVIMSNAVEMFGVEPENNFPVEEDEYKLKFVGEVRILASRGAVLANCKVFKDSVLEENRQLYKNIKCSEERVKVIGNIYENPELLK